MNIATAPGSPFRRAIDVSTMPDHFLPGDGRAAKGVTHPAQLSPAPDLPLSTEDFVKTREAALVAERELAARRQEEEAMSQKRAEVLAFQQEVAEFQLDIQTTLEKISLLESEWSDGATESRRCAESIHQTIQVLQKQLAKIQEVNPEEWTKARMQSELDRALDLLTDVEQTTKTEMTKLSQELPRRMMPVRNGFWDKAIYAVGSALAFLLPLIAFIAIAVILLLSALRLV